MQVAPSSNFCSRCGRPQNPLAVSAEPPPPSYYYYPQQRTQLRDVVRGVGAYSVLALAILMTVNVAIVIWGIALIYPHMDRHIYLYVITPFITNFAELGGWAFMFYYVFLVSAITASFIWLVYRSVRPLKAELGGKVPEKGHSPLYIVGTIFLAVMAFNVIFYFLVNALGIVPNTPSFETRELWQLIYGLAAASVWEEIVSRILLIGVPLLLIDGFIRMSRPEAKMRRLSPHSPASRWPWRRMPRVGDGMNIVSRYILGGGFDIGRKEAVLLVFSSIIFGAAHLFSWDAYKIFPAAIAGLAFGYVFLKLGVYASIILHFAFDFLSVPLSVWPDSILVTLLIGIIVLVWVAAGIPFAMLYFSKGIGWLLGRRIWPDVPEEPPRSAFAIPAAYPAPLPTYSPSPYPTGGPQAPRDPGPGFVCPNCGNREAIYQDGGLTCTRCKSRN
jgi:hypothetical protein